MIILSEVRKRKTNDITYVWNQKTNVAKELIYKTESDSQSQKTNLGLPKEKDGRNKLGVWD